MPKLRSCHALWWLALFGASIVLPTTCSFIPQTHLHVALNRRQLVTKRDGHFLHTSYERLALERAMEDEGTSIAWIDPNNFKLCERPIDGERTMPIYPLGACYLPSQTMHTLNNVEPRNVKMAEDLIEGGRWKDTCFCAVLCTADSGRIGAVGTVMRIEKIEKHVNRDDSISRIVVTCRAEELVDIVAVNNPDAASSESRIQCSSEYLVGTVRSKQNNEQEVNSKDDKEMAVIKKILDDYHAVRSLYLGGAGASELPPFARDHLVGALPEWNEKDLSESFWTSAQVWQTLCYTVREGRQMNLVADVNEVMVASACKKGGPLKLPIHIGDLSPEVRKKVDTMEVEAQNEFVGLRLDPCLDFQALLSINDSLKRLKFLSRLISRERRRLESLPIDKQSSVTDRDEKEPPKGAWFEGFE